MVIAAAGSLYSQIDKALSLITPPNVTNPIEFWLAFLLILNVIISYIHFNKILYPINIFIYHIKRYYVFK